MSEPEFKPKFFSDSRDASQDQGNISPGKSHIDKSAEVCHLQTQDLLLVKTIFETVLPGLMTSIPVQSL